MAIAITNLGTAISKALTYVQLATTDGLAGSLADTVITCVSSDTAVPTLARYSAGANSYDYFMTNVANVANTGNAYMGVWVGFLPRDVVAGDNILISSAEQAWSITCYRVSGVRKEAYATTGSQIDFYTMASYYDCIAQVMLKAGTITSFRFRAYRGAGTDGTLTLTLRSPLGPNHDQVGSPLGSVNISSLTTDVAGDWYTITGSLSVPSTGLYWLNLEASNGASACYIERQAIGSQIMCGFVSNGSVYTQTIDRAPTFSIEGTPFYTVDLDKSATATGTSTAPSSGATEALSQADELIVGAISAEDSGDAADLKGVWTTGAGNVSGNEQKVGTTGGGDASNISVYAAAEVVSSTAAQTAAVTGCDSIDWAAVIATFKGVTVAAAAARRRMLLGVGV